MTVKLTDIVEWQKLNATYALGGSSNLSNTLNSFKANASFVWDHTYSLGFGYFNINGSSDCNLYGSAAAPCLPNGLGDACLTRGFGNADFGRGSRCYVSRRRSWLRADARSWLCTDRLLWLNLGRCGNDGGRRLGSKLRFVTVHRGGFSFCLNNFKTN